MFIFARHGQTEWNKKDITQGHQDVELNATGRKQAKALRTWIEENAQLPDAYYASDLERAAETARIVANGQEVTTDERLREQNFGDVQGQNMADFISRNPEYRPETLADYERTWPNGESTMDVYRRVSEALDDIKEQHEAEDTVLVVAHATPFICLQDYLGQATLLEASYPDNDEFLLIPFDGTSFGTPMWRST